jgi:orotate phosphoribosyltransferase
MDSFESTAMVVYTTPGVFGTFEKPIILKSRRLSPYYIQNRLIPSHPDKQDTILSNFEEALNGAGLPDGYKITTTEAAGILFASPLGDVKRLGRPVSFVKKKKKGYGLPSMVEGDVQAGDYVVAVDDLVTTALSGMHLVNVIRSRDAKIEKYWVIFDRNEGGKEGLAKEGVELYPLVWMGDRFVEFGKGIDALNEEEVVLLGDYVKGPLDWSRNYIQMHPEFIKEKVVASIRDKKIIDNTVFEIFTDAHPELYDEFFPKIKAWCEAEGVKTASLGNPL